MNKKKQLSTLSVLVLGSAAALGALFLQRGLLTAQLVGFPDSPIFTLEGKAAATLRDKGVVTGFPDGELKAYEPINRAQVAKMLLLFKNVSADSTTTTQFTDVLPGSWYASFVNTASRLRIVDGYSDHSFRPQNTINTVEFLKMLTNTFNVRTGIPHNYKDVPSNAWYNNYAGLAYQFNLLPGRKPGFLYPDARLTRGEVIIALYLYEQATKQPNNAGILPSIGAAQSVSSVPFTEAAGETENSTASQSSSEDSFLEEIGIPHEGNYSSAVSQPEENSDDGSFEDLPPEESEYYFEDDNSNHDTYDEFNFDEHSSGDETAYAPDPEEDWEDWNDETTFDVPENESENSNFAQNTVPMVSVPANSSSSQNPNWFLDMILGKSSSSAPFSSSSSSSTPKCTQRKFFASEFPFSPAHKTLAADINKDGRDDLLALFGGTLSIYTNMGDKNFALTDTRSISSSNGSELQVADVDSDGQKDIVTVTGSFAGDMMKFVFSLLRNSNGRFEGHEPIFAPPTPGTTGFMSATFPTLRLDKNNTIIGQFEFDGKLRSISNYWNGFSATQSKDIEVPTSALGYGTNTTKGKAQSRIISDKPWKGSYVITTSTLAANSLISLDGTVIQRGGNSIDTIRSLHIGDIDSDGVEDIVAVVAELVTATPKTFQTRIDWFNGSSLERKTLAEILSPASSYIGGKDSWIDLGDIDGDKDIDIAVSTRTDNEFGMVYWMENKGSAWAYNILSNDLPKRSDVAIGDFNGDTKKDIATGGWPTYVFVQSCQ